MAIIKLVPPSAEELARRVSPKKEAPKKVAAKELAAEVKEEK